MEKKPAKSQARRQTRRKNSKKSAPTDLMQQMEAASEAADIEQWEGSFRDYLDLFETSDNPNLGVLSHARVYNMVMSAETEEHNYFGKDRIKYNFFESRLFGVEDAIDNVMSFIHSAAQKTETSRRMLLLYGPPSSGKSQFVQLVKRGLEHYTRTPDGAMYAIKGSKMNENPLLLVPEHLRPDFEKKYGVKIEGQLSPLTQWRVDNEYKGKFLNVPIQRVFINEAERKGIGTWLPQDPKSSDQSELVGSIDFAKIQEYGSESDPRAYNFDGELNVANRGIMEFIEGLKADERFLRVLLTATQEKAIKAPRFGLIYCDAFIILHTNEAEFLDFMHEQKYEAYHDRMVMIPFKYNLSVSNEVKIYEQLLMYSDAVKGMHIAPHTLEAAAMFAVLTRLEDSSDGDLNLIKKMKLYNGQHVRGMKREQVPDIKKRHPREGMFGVSPRFVIDQIAAAISNARKEKRDYITPLDVLRQLNRGVRNRDTFNAETKNKYESYIDMARVEWNDMLRNDIQKAFFLSFENEARALCENYMDQIVAACSGQKPRDPITNEEVELDEKLMNSIEDQINITESGREDFRNEIIRAVAVASKKGTQFDYTEHAQLREAIQKQLFQERQNVIRMTVSSRNPEPEALQRINAVVDRMVKQQRYSAGSANALLKYATSHLFEK